MKSPIVELITPEKKPEADNQPKEYTDEELFDYSMANVTNNASWDLCDVVISTPLILANILKRKNKVAPLKINPQTVVIDEVDLLLGLQDTREITVEILRKFASK